MEILQKILHILRCTYFFINKNVKKEKIEIIKIESENNPADIFDQITGKSKTYKFSKC